MKPVRLVTIFFIAFLANFAWEHIHAVLYVHYQGSPISEFVLLHATFVDALLISATVFLTRFFPQHLRPLFFSAILLIVAIGIEWWALATHRWAYATAMPIIPLLAVGLSPTIQLVATAWFSVWITRNGRSL